MMLDTEVLVIGGGLTGAGVLRDLALRGVPALLVEQRDFNSGASGANHGLLHSGGRYVVSDPESAAECVAENAVQKRVAPGCIEDCGGLFVSLPGDDERYIERFMAAAARVGLEARLADVKQVLDEEPLLSRAITAAVRVPDAAINPFLATRRNLKAACDLGARVLLHTQVTGMERRGAEVVRVECRRGHGGEEVTIRARQVVCAAGPWVDKLGAMVGLHIPIAYSKGSLLITNSRLVGHVINRLRPPSDGDIIVPGETVTITGTNSVRVRSLSGLGASAAEVDLLVREAAHMVPALAETRFIRVYSGVRPLVLSEGADGDRQLSRTFTVFDHEADGLRNVATITGGKLTTYRLMAERVCDLVCRRLGVTQPCRTAEVPLMGDENRTWLDPRDRLGRLRAPAPHGAVLCECEMVDQRAAARILGELRDEDGVPVSLTAFRLRSRLGMGSCQGGFCGHRTVGWLYAEGAVTGKQGNEMLMTFLERRWSGIRPVLWGEQLRQEQLLEAIYCGTFNIDGNL